MSEQQYHEYNERLPDSYSGADFELDQLIQMNKATITQNAKDAVAAVADGHVDEFKAYCYAKRICEVGALLESNLRPYVAKSSRLGKVAEVHYGVEIKRQETGVKFDYSACGCPKWADLKHIADTANADLKQHEAMLKTIKQPTPLIYVDEVYTCMPPLRTSTDGFTSTIK